MWECGDVMNERMWKCEHVEMWKCENSEGKSSIINHAPLIIED